MALQMTQIVILLVTLMVHGVMVRSGTVPVLSRQELSYLLGEGVNSRDSYQDLKFQGKASDMELNAQSKLNWLRQLISTEIENRKNAISDNDFKEEVPMGPPAIAAKPNPPMEIHKRYGGLPLEEYMRPCWFKNCPLGRKRSIFAL